MSKIDIDFATIQKSQDAEVQVLVQQIEANRQAEDLFDQEMEDQLVSQLSDLLQEKLEALMAERDLDVEEAMENISIEDIINYDVPKEVATDIDSLALDDANLIDKDIFDKFKNNTDAVEPKVYDKIFNINMKSKVVDALEEEIEIR